MRTILLLLLTATTMFTQAQQVNGLAKDDNGTAVGGATISLMKATDSSVIKLAVTKPDGTYGFSGIREGNYKVLASHVGYKPVFSSKFSLGGSDVTVPELKLSKIAGNLNNVTVTANKPMVEVKADKNGTECRRHHQCSWIKCIGTAA
ncbi:MAG: carboxypeptidase-like regulatory domain-containing protein [Bacteroidota bacterium]